MTIIKTASYVFWTILFLLFAWYIAREIYRRKMKREILSLREINNTFLTRAQSKGQLVVHMTNDEREVYSEYKARLKRVIAIQSRWGKFFMFYM